LAFSPDGSVIGSGRLDGVRLWDVAATWGTTKLEAGRMLAVAYAHDGKILATGGEGDGTVTLWDTSAGKARPRLAGLAGDNAATALAFSADGRTLAVATTDNETQYSFDRRVIRGHEGTGIALSVNSASPGHMMINS
jgi:WD40 repeat protein